MYLTKMMGLPLLFPLEATKDYGLLGGSCRWTYDLGRAGSLCPWSSLKPPSPFSQYFGTMKNIHKGPGSVCESERSL